MTLNALCQRIVKACWIAAIGGGISACAPSMDHSRESLIADINALVARAEATPATPAAPVLPAAVSDALIPDVSVQLPGVSSAMLEERFDLSVQDSPAREFFMGLVEGTDFNMVVHPEVSGRLSLDMKNVTIEEVMETVREVFGYEYQQMPGGFRVLPARLQSRLFRVNYLNVKRSGRSHTRVSSGQLTETLANGDGDSGGEETQDRALASSRIETQQQSDFWQELDLALQAIVGSADGRKVVLSPQAGIVVVRAMPMELREVADFLETTQALVQRQVILEAKILEVSLNDGFQSGINWAKLSRIDGGTKSLLVGQTGGGTVFADPGLSDIAGQSGNLDPGNFSQINGNLASAFGGTFTLAANTNHFSAFIELLQTQGDVQVLSSPRISTMNNQKAVIKVGTDEFFVTKVSSTTTTGTTTTTTPEVELTPFFSGIALDVTPQIDDDGEVTLHIHPSVSDVVDQTKVVTIGGLQQSLPLALSSVRESDSIVRARSGQVVVLGGLMQTELRDEVASTPLLGDLPVVGPLFRQTRQAEGKSELVILLRPLVIDSHEGWGEPLQEMQERLNGYRTASQPPGPG